jgi:hypothetical protein
MSHHRKKSSKFIAQGAETVPKLVIAVLRVAAAGGESVNESSNSAVLLPPTSFFGGSMGIWIVSYVRRVLDGSNHATNQQGGLASCCQPHLGQTNAIGHLR